MINLSNIPTHLFCGDEHATHKILLDHLKGTYCTTQLNECHCHVCAQIQNNQHPSILWIAPEKSYVLKDIAVIFEKIKFQLDPGTSFFFILQNVHLLTKACANKMLKILEEPPEGYIFFLTTNNEHAILETIRSRCHIHRIKTPTQHGFLNPLLTFFIDPQKRCPLAFEAELKKQNLSDQESTQLLYTLIDHMQQKMRTDPTYIKQISFFKAQMEKPPQSGSANLFWKNVFLQNLFLQDRSYKG